MRTYCAWQTTWSGLTIYEAGPEIEYICCLLKLSMDGYISNNPESVKVTFIDFIFGKGESSVINRKNLR